MSNYIQFNQFLYELKIRKTKLAYHKTLNPKIWVEEDGEFHIEEKVYKKMIKIANAFIDSLEINKKYITDIIFTGSNTNYNYSELSDIDIHVIADFSKLKGKIKPEEYFNTKKSYWNLTHDIQIQGHDVEVYVSNIKDDLVGDAAAYSLQNKEWIQKPKREIPKFNQALIKIKASHFASMIDRAIKSNDPEILEKLNDKIGKMRKAGLASHGEFSLENLVFKALRNNKYIEKLRSKIKSSESLI